MKCLFVICIALTFTEISSKSLLTKAREYFESAVAKTFERKWKPYGNMYENTIRSSLKEAFGHKSLNVYINRFQNPLVIGSGYYHTDNQVKLILQTMILEALPQMYEVEVTFPLSSNLLLFEASISKMILHTKYSLFRNEADIIYGTGDQDANKNSPFRFQQVSSVGDLAITIEGCSLSGRIVATLNGNSVNLGHQELRLSDCQYNIEIYTLGSGAPPVIANYLPKGDKGLSLDTLLLRPLTEELMPKLQAIMFSEVNTSSIFGNDLIEIRSKQAQVLEDTRSCIDEVVRSMNAKAIENDMGTITLEDFFIRWDDTYVEIPAAKFMKLSKMTLLGLDTLYAAHTGGPVQLTATEILEQFRFGTLQITGNILMEQLNGVDGEHFAVEISDFAFDATIDSAHKITFEALGWRYLEFSCSIEILPIELYVVGYLLKELPERLKRHLDSVYNRDGPDHLNIEYDASVIDEQSLDGKYDADTAEMLSNENNANVETYDDIPFKLNKVVAKPYENGYEKANLHGSTSEEENLSVKLHNVDAKPEHDEGQVQIHRVISKPYEEEKDQVKLQAVQVKPYPDETDLDNTRLQLKLSDAVPAEYLDVQLNNTPYHKRNGMKLIKRTNANQSNKRKKGKLVKGSLRIKPNRTRMLQKSPISSKIAKQKSKTILVKSRVTNVTTPHMSDNEIHSN